MFHSATRRRTKELIDLLYPDQVKKYRRNRYSSVAIVTGYGLQRRVRFEIGPSVVIILKVGGPYLQQTITIKIALLHSRCTLRFSLRLPGFQPRSGHMGFVVDKAALGQVFSDYFGFPG
jgi:hypothetical protein